MFYKDFFQGNTSSDISGNRIGCAFGICIKYSGFYGSGNAWRRKGHGHDQYDISADYVYL